MSEEKNKDALEKVRELTVNLLLEVKGAALRAGANPLKHIDQIQTRVMVAARTSASVEEWYTTLARKLQLGAPSSSASSVLESLVVEVRDTIGSAGFLDMVEREHGYLIALMRLAHERVREARDAQRAARETRKTIAETKAMITEDFEKGLAGLEELHGIEFEEEES